MSQTKHIIWKNKIFAILILLVTFGLTCIYYRNTYNLTADQSILSSSISDYIYHDSVNAEVRLIQKDNGWMYVVFTDNQYGDSFKGLARLKRGWNYKYVLYDVYYGSGYPVSQYSFRNDKSKIAIYGLLTDSRAVRYEFVDKSTTELNVLYSGKISQKAFVHIHDNVNTYTFDLHLYDANDNGITESYINYVANSAPQAGISTAELFIVDFISGFILLLGFILAIRCWSKRNHKRQII